MPAIECTIIEAVVFKRVQHTPRYLLLKRAPTEVLYPDTWQIVTGTIESGETAVAAAVREMAEETALRIGRFWAVPTMGSFYDVRRDSVQLCPLFAAEVAPDAEPRLSSEHHSFQWVAAENAFQFLVWPGHHQAVKTVHEFIVTEREAARLTEINLATLERKIP